MRRGRAGWDSIGWPLRWSGPIGGGAGGLGVRVRDLVDFLAMFPGEQIAIYNRAEKNAPRFLQPRGVINSDAFKRRPWIADHFAEDIKKGLRCAVDLFVGTRGNHKLAAGQSFSAIIPAERPRPSIRGG